MALGRSLGTERSDANTCPTGRAPGEEPDFQGPRRQAGAQLEALARLPSEPRLSLLDALRELLQSPWALQELEDRVRGLVVRAGRGWGDERQEWEMLWVLVAHDLPGPC